MVCQLSGKLLPTTTTYYYLLPKLNTDFLGSYSMIKVMHKERWELILCK